ncbi:long-chain-alcohol o-fatty-acyltransferase [Quercus suber]|uniref:Long-chain-alcohol o-fatty-acyltransferase n=1 Tax=Quercus suber TaxID=58331 RepID=A0AAW0J4U5_QUESU
MDAEIKNFIKVWITAITSLCYCYYIVARIPRGMIRLFFLLPVFYLFTMLPCNLNSFHLGGSTAFFLGWLGNFKLLLFAFDQGPLSPPLPKLLHFISIACLPIKLKQDPPPNTKNNKNPSHKNTPKSHNPTKVPRSMLLVIKILFLSMIICAYDYRPNLHSYVILVLYCCNTYLVGEIILALAAAPVQAIFGFKIEPQFNEPYLATSLQDFWGHRWNLMVTSILRPTIYIPIRRISANVIGSRWATLPAIISTFIVSGLAHEVTWFFVLHGICTAVEVVVKKAVTNKWQLHRAISGPLTIGFVVVTSFWLFFPQLIRNGMDQKAIKEYSILAHFVKVNLPLQLHLDKS